jgi:urease accessory protein
MNLIAIILTLTPSILMAHGTQPIIDIFGFKSGFLHPVMGLDHLLAMLCVGMISSRIGKKAIWQVPLCFVAVMALGCVVGFYSGEIGFLEYVISLSVVIFGFLFLSPRYLSLKATLITVAIFAFAHGVAHGKDMPIFVLPEIYILGFITSTATIHIMGVSIGEIINRLPKSKTIIKITGLGLILAGIILFTQ